MDIDLKSVELVFAQKLACGEPPVRQKALKVLHNWIDEQSAKKPFEMVDLKRLCKGLHYVLWMQDKMLLQEELADRIAGLHSHFQSEDEKVLYVKAFLVSLSMEWGHIDRWRMDKFLMAVRRMLRTVFSYLASLSWNAKIMEKYWEAFKETTISTESSIMDSLKFHFASLYLDELDHAGGLTTKTVLWCLQPYAELLGNTAISDYFFRSVVDEVFNTILEERSSHFNDMEEDEAEGDQSDGLKFDYQKIREMLFDVGKGPSVRAKRRSQIYSLVKKFELAAAGKDPLAVDVPVPREVLTKEDYERAEKAILKRLDEEKKAKIQWKKSKKLQASSEEKASKKGSVIKKTPKKAPKRRLSTGGEKKSKRRTKK